ncbi:PIR protein [Plasmodium sp. DRC-Itaito]|nr:PIR protein [Plasmodium sp. DRC-Itaito]
MKVHYVNILLFSLPLNILETLCHVNTHKNPPITHHTLNTRLLCECELYAPVNYDNDPEMKSVMENFYKQTQQRFHAYDDRMVEKRKQCKEQCDKEIRKIILKDKLEKELMDKLSTLHTDIQNDAIPSCVCEKSLADKTEKFCLNCGMNVGAIAPWWGLVCGSGYAGWLNYVATTIAKMATDAGIKEGVKVGLVKVTEIATKTFSLRASEIPAINGAKLITLGKFTDGVTFSDIFKAIDSNAGQLFDAERYSLFSFRVQGTVENARTLRSFTEQSTAVSTAFNNAQTSILTKAGNVTSNLTTGIIASVVAIVVIVLIMVIIYLFLRYRRKKKMKKKLKYIKLLEE